MKPSDYFHRNFGVTFEDDEAGVLTRHLIGVDNLLWGNDYPHHDAIWPHSMETLDKIFVDVPDDERERMCFTNTVRALRHRRRRPALSGRIRQLAVAARRRGRVADAAGQQVTAVSAPRPRS